jgi:hypothetical protein
VCNSLLHNCPGGLMCAFLTESRTADAGVWRKGSREKGLMGAKRRRWTLSGNMPNRGD